MLMTYIRLNHNIQTDETKDLALGNFPEFPRISQLLQSLIGLNFFFTLVFVTIFLYKFMKTITFWN